jgi:hemoglobin
MNQQDITTAEDIRILVDAFYEQANADDLLGPVFREKITDWSKHLPVMYAFWGNILLGTNEYRGQPFPKHLPLPIRAEHFNRWVNLFTQTIDEHFKGEKAEEAKTRAQSISAIFQHKMGLI